MNPREHALKVLVLPNPSDKVAAMAELWDAAQSHAWIGSDHSQRIQLSHPQETQAVPGRPLQPQLVPPNDVLTRSPFTTEGRAALIHAICHIEFNAINLALDAVWRFPDMPTAYYMDWLRVAYEESTHFAMLRTHLNDMPHPQGGSWDYGDFTAHDGLWAMCEKTA